MSRRSTNPYHELKRLRHHMAILELKYQYAKDAGMAIICDRLARKASHILERIEKARAIIAVSFRRDWDEAKEMNQRRDDAKARLIANLKAAKQLSGKENDDANTSDSGPDLGADSESGLESGKQLAGQPESQSGTQEGTEGDQGAGESKADPS